MRIMAALPLLLLLPVASSQVIPFYNELPEPQPWPSCGIEPVVFADAEVGFENLHFLEGVLYLTAFEDGLYQAFANGRVEHITTPDPGRNGPEVMGLASMDGALYVSQGLGVTTDVDGRVLRFPEPGLPAFEVFATGFGGANGMVAAPDGHLYLAHGFRTELYRIAPDGSWTTWAEGLVPNGLSLHPDGDRLVVGQVGELGSGVEAWSLADPSQREQLFAFNAVNTGAPVASDPGAPVVPHLMDDVAVTADGRVLLTSHERFKTLMGDPATGEACVLFEHADSPTSVRVAEGFGSWDGMVFAVDLAGVIQAADIGLMAAPSQGGEEGDLADDAGAGDDGDEEAPGAGAAFILLALALAAFVGRRRAGTT
ncbi:MAG: SMP-30/gluconolactonase/LRE family protein [Thermoplasmatota archaeon]